MQQEHGCRAFMALLREAAAGTEAPLAAWRRKLGPAPVEALVVCSVVELRPV